MTRPRIRFRAAVNGKALSAVLAQTPIEKDESISGKRRGLDAGEQRVFSERYFGWIDTPFVPRTW